MDYGSGQKLAAALKTTAKWMYWIVGILLVMGTCVYLYNTMNRPVAGILVFLAGVLALYFYYVKWFVVADIQGAWPPYQTTCPDYLTLIAPDSTTAALTGSAQKFKCMDLGIGVSRNGLLKKASNPPTAAEKANPEYFIEFTAGDMTDSNARNTLKGEVMRRGLTWSTLFTD